MSEETIWILKMLSERHLSAQMASRILQALEILREKEENSISTAVIPEVQEKLDAESQEIYQIVMTGEILERESEVDESKFAVFEDIGPETEQSLEVTPETEPNPPPGGEMVIENETQVELLTNSKGKVPNSLNLEMQIPEAVSHDLQLELEQREIPVDVIEERLSEEKSEIQILETTQGNIIPELSAKEIEDSQEGQAELLETTERPSENLAEPIIVNKDLNLLQQAILNGSEESDIKLAEQIETTDDTEDMKSNTVIAPEDEPLLAQGKESLEAEEKLTATEGTELHQDTQISPDSKFPNLVISDGTEITFKKEAGSITIQSWDQIGLNYEGKEQLISIYQESNNVKIDIDGDEDFLFHIPPEVKKIRIFSSSGPVKISSYNYDMFVSSDMGDIYVNQLSGELKAKTIKGDIAIEDCQGSARLESESGRVAVRGITSANNKDFNEAASLGEDLNSISEYMALNQGKFDSDLEVSVQTSSGDINLEDITGSINARSNGEIIRLKNCRGKDIFVESKGGNIDIKDIASNIILKCENGEIKVEEFFGKIKVNAKDTNISLMKSGDAQIYIDSDGGNVDIEDCYADAYVNSGKGDVTISGGNLSFDAMGRIDLKMKTGDAYLFRRTFEDIRVSIENGNAEVSMEKLNSGGSGNINVYKGNITLRVSPNFRFDFSAQASRKRIHLDLPVEILEKDKNSLRGVLNNGGSKINLNAPEGEIFLQAL